MVTNQNAVLSQIAQNQSSSAAALCQSALDATKEAIGKNWAYLRGVNLNATDLSYSALYEADLAESVFFGAKLKGTNLRCANLDVVELDRSLHWKTADFTYAFVKNLAPYEIRRWALDHHALDLGDDEWQSWRANQFRIQSGQPVLKGEAGRPASCMGPEE